MRSLPKSFRPSKADCDRLNGYLRCPECDTQAIPASLVVNWNKPMWTEDDTADCPGCGLHLEARFACGGEHMVAVVVEVF